YEHSLKGYNYRMDGLQGAILRVKLRHLEAWTEARRKNAAGYNELLSDNGIQTPRQMPYARHVYHIYSIRTSQRELLQHVLSAHGVHTGIHYPIPVHLQQAYADLGYRPCDFPCSERIAQEVLSLPMYPELQEPAQTYVAQCIFAEMKAKS